ncbi:MAG: hypothetical protein A2070_10475 [Bdellovibrionales bacterium GWC1_52_8]|nr:MAG: hypothetical protein A2Z97_12715 [Bdellovibrionales bacterium GWB1_52_6]OFZ02854.1 MAG: hypothetical protein A2X97_04585 [Bdellovibrionales bacterium GWA1_52_35]OFZ40246.1 MAG: hypothetical protein A2070_10475 [Bdellovibrionales bacterium GWC1_52_8]HCM38436.1 hypothetical protein [Bdellovibrionales bacterium]
MKILRITAVLVAFGSILTSPAAFSGEQRCSQSDLISALQKLDSRERVAKIGLNLWEGDIKRLESDARGAQSVAFYSKAALSTGLLAGAWAGLIADIIVLEAAVVPVSTLSNTGSQLMTGAVLFSALGVHGWNAHTQDKYRKPIPKNPMIASRMYFSNMDKAHGVITAARQKATTSRVKDLYTFGSSTAKVLKLQAEEASLHTDLYKQELQYIAKLRPVLRDAIDIGGCKQFNAAQNDQKLKSLSEAPGLADEILESSAAKAK